MANNDIPPKVVKPGEAAHIISVSRSTFYRRQGQPGFPKIVRDGGARVFVLVSDINQWIESLQS